ncbi:MAG: hypothetical protein ABIQ32_01515 [Sphingomicrobium sp.]
MAMVRPALALDPRRFGRRFVLHAEEADGPSFEISDDLRLFATTFAAGFLFVSLLIA